MKQNPTPDDLHMALESGPGAGGSPRRQRPARFPPITSQEEIDMWNDPEPPLWQTVREAWERAPAGDIAAGLFVVVLWFVVGAAFLRGFQ